MPARDEADEIPLEELEASNTCSRGLEYEFHSKTSCSG